MLSFNNAFSLNGGDGGSSTALSLINRLSNPSTTTSALKITAPDLPPPEEPDYSELLAAYGAVPGVFNPRKLLRTFDSAIGASRLSAAQQGRNAGAAYSNRLMQQGVAPVAGGVVEAMGRRAGNENTRALMSEREGIALNAKKESMNLQAMIADKLAGIRDSYTKTVADYNARKAGLEFDTSSTNAANELKAAELNQRGVMTAAELAARMAAAGGTDDGDADREARSAAEFVPGYIPSFGPIFAGRGYKGANSHNVMVGW